MNSAVAQNFGAAAFEHALRHGGVAFLRNQLGGVVGRQFVGEEEIGHGQDVAQAA